MVYVISKTGHPLMPSRRHGKVRRMLKTGKAKVVKRCPFTVQLLYDTEENVQPVSLGVDAGSKHVGLSATTTLREIFAAQAELRSDITGLISTRRENRSARRGRKTRHRGPRFENRTNSKPKGWIAPSVKHKVDTHVSLVQKVCEILPVQDIYVEVASFDMQKLKADLQNLKEPQGKDYQKGEQMGFWNVREYVLARDNHTCQCCKGKSKDKRLNVHHIESRKTGGNAPNNLVTLCETCHKALHEGKITLPKSIASRRMQPLRDAAFMGIMRWKVYERLKALYPNVKLTYGYITKNTRITNGLEKSHIVDARCISGNPLAEPAEECFFTRKVRRHNRQIHKMSIAKGGARKLNQAPYKVKGFRLFDKVVFEGEECFIFGRRKTGYFDVRKLDGMKVHVSASYKKLTLVEPARGYIIERSRAIPLGYE